MGFLATVILLYLLPVLPCLLGESQAIHWTGSLHDNDLIYNCKDSDVTLPWKYQLGNDEIVTDIEWYFDGKSQEIIGILAHGQFLPYPAFSGRVSPTENAGITLTGLLPGDSGNYSVVIKGHEVSGQYFELKKTVFVNVSDQVMTQHGPLHVSQSTEPVLDIFTGQWAVRLVCGEFSFQGKPTYDVQWIFPDGSLHIVHNSAYFNGTHFTFLLTSPVRGGSYTCRVPRQHSCINGQGLMTAEASIQVNAMDARLTLLEKVTAVENQRLERRANETARQLQTVTAELQRLSRENEGLKRLLLKHLNGTEMGPKAVSFHATNWNGNGSHPLVLPDVRINLGNGYDNSTGYFTAPVAGVYVFYAKTIPYGKGWLGLFLNTRSNGDVSQIDVTNVYRDESRPMAAVHGLARLNSGDTAWVSCAWSGNAVPGYGYTAFSGFLISSDLD